MLDRFISFVSSVLSGGRKNVQDEVMFGAHGTVDGFSLGDAGRGDSAAELYYNDRRQQ